MPLAREEFGRTIFLRTSNYKKSVTYLVQVKQCIFHLQLSGRLWIARTQPAQTKKSFRWTKEVRNNQEEWKIWCITYVSPYLESGLMSIVYYFQRFPWNLRFPTNQGTENEWYGTNETTQLAEPQQRTLQLVEFVTLWTRLTFDKELLSSSKLS